MSNLFAFIRQASDQYQPTVSAYKGNQQAYKSLTAQAKQVRAEAERMQEDCDRMQQVIDSQEHSAAQLSQRLRELAHQRERSRDSAQSDQDSRREEAQLTAQLERIRDRITMLSQNLRSAVIETGRLEGRAQESEDLAQQRQIVMDNTRGKCGKIADLLDNHAAAIKAEAGLVRNQANQFSSLTSNRFGSAGAGAASQRETYAKKLDSLSNDTALLAQHYRFIAENVGNWSMIEGNHNISSDLSAANPNYDPDSFAWSCNCQRCVPTYEMRRRGYNVTAEAIASGSDHLAYHPFDVWQNPKVHKCSGSGLSDIQSAMHAWGDGARAQIVVYWDNGQGGHTFAAEQVNGTTRFVDPQTNEVYDAEWVFSNVEHGATSFCRIDNLRPSDWVLKCCKEA